VKVKIEPFTEDRFLESDEAMSAYLNLAIQDDDSRMLMDALEKIAEAKGMTAVIKESGVSREDMRKALNIDAFLDILGVAPETVLAAQ
jgi:probable addiction module antidote protein